MMSNKVEVIMSAQDAQLVRAWQNARNNVSAYDSQLKTLDGTQKRTAQSGKQFNEAVDWKEMISNAFAMAGAAGGIGGALSIAVGYQRELLAELEKSSLEMDVLNRKFMVQAGLNDLQGATATKQIIDVAENNGITVEAAHNLARQLVSSGFQNPESTGTADAVAKIMASSNLDASQGEDVAKAIGQFLASFGLEKNAANLFDIGVRTRGLFQGTDVQVSDLSEFAKAAPAFKTAGVSKEDTLSALAILREQENAGEAATHGRQIISQMTTFSTDKKKVAELEKRGLKPEQFDLVGETLPEALATFKDAMKTMSTAEKSEFMKIMFDSANYGAAVVLAENVDKFKTFGEAQNDKAGFEQGVRTNQSGVTAQLNRIEARKARQRLVDADKANTDNLYKEEFKRADEQIVSDAKAAGPLGLFGSLGTGVKAKIRDTMVWSGVVSPSDIASQENIDNVKRGRQSNFSIGDFEKDLAGKPPGGPPPAAPAAPVINVAAPNVQIVMPGSGAPAKPVAAAGIKGRRNP